jgi:hypothetical protein
MRSIGQISLCLAAAAILSASATMSQTTPTQDDAAEAAAHRQHMMKMHGESASPAAEAGPRMPGQDAFGAIQEIVGILEADPATDWSKVDLEGLRQHLIDMNEVTLKAKVASEPIDGGAKIAVTGEGRTLAAIRRMVAAHGQAINGYKSWRAETAPLPDGVLLVVTSSDAKEAAHIRGLGFIGIMVSGAHHLPHHLAMARGAFAHGK